MKRMGTRDPGVPFGLLEDVEAAFLRARTKKTLRGYENAVEVLRLWCEKHKEELLVKNVTRENEDGKIEIDFKKLAKSLEIRDNIYFRYTMCYQIMMQKQQKSGLGHIKRLRSGLSKMFLDERIELSQTARRACELWTRSRKNDDMTAKTRGVNPVKYSNAQKSLPWPVYQKIAQVLAMKGSPFVWCLFVLQWNMIARISNASTIKFSLMEWDNDRLKIKHAKTKKDQDGRNLAHTFAKEPTSAV